MRFSITLRLTAHHLGDGVHNVQWQPFIAVGSFLRWLCFVTVRTKLSLLGDENRINPELKGRREKLTITSFEFY